MLKCFLFFFIYCSTNFILKYYQHHFIALLKTFKNLHSIQFNENCTYWSFFILFSFIHRFLRLFISEWPDFFQTCTPFSPTQLNDPSMFFYHNHIVKTIQIKLTFIKIFCDFHYFCIFSPLPIWYHRCHRVWKNILYLKFIVLTDCEMSDGRNDSSEFSYPIRL